MRQSSMNHSVVQKGLKLCDTSLVHLHSIWKDIEIYMTTRSIIRLFRNDVRVCVTSWSISHHFRENIGRCATTQYYASYRKHRIPKPGDVLLYRYFQKQSKSRHFYDKQYNKLVLSIYFKREGNCSRST